MTAAVLSQSADDEPGEQRDADDGDRGRTNSVEAHLAAGLGLGELAVFHALLDDHFVQRTVEVKRGAGDGEGDGDEQVEFVGGEGSELGVHVGNGWGRGGRF